jgi:prolyl oligopeptidase
MRRTGLSLGVLVILGCTESVHPPAHHDTIPPAVGGEGPRRAEASHRAIEGLPVTRRQDVTDLYHGTKVIDPYRWMETESAERSQWFAAQNAYARGILASLPDREALRHDLHEANRLLQRLQILSVAGSEPRIFVLRRTPSEETFKLVVRFGWLGSERVLVDPSNYTKSGSHATIDAAYPSPDGRYVAYVVSNSGSEDGTLEIVDVDSAKILPDRIDREPLKVSWRSDGQSFFYWRRAKLLPDTKPADKYKDSASYLHILGQSPDNDVAVIAAGNEQLGIRPHDLPWVEAISNSPWTLAGATSGTGDPAYFVAPRPKIKGRSTPWRRVTTRDDKVESIVVHGDDLYAFTYSESLNYSIVVFNGRSGSLAKARTFVRSSDLVLMDFAGAADAMYVVALDRGLHRLFRVSWKTGSSKEIPLPFEGSINKLVTTADRPGVIFNMEGWTIPPVWLQFDLNGGVHQLPMTASGATVEGLVAEQRTVISHDGEQVPLSIIRRRDQALDGSASAFMFGYGAYGISNNPTYNPLALTWVKRNGIYAICHVRGGGERGKAWHLAGIKERKENGVLDYIACAEYLVKHRYTRPQRLTAFGASAGGIVIGGAITKRPDLFAAMIVRVGQLNPLRKEVTEGASINVDEYGDVRVESEFRSLLASDPYHRIRDDVDYPAVLLTAGMHDARVSPWVPAKFAARLQSVSAKPTLLRLDSDDGHGFTSTQTQREDEYADIYAFALWRSGIDAK